MYNEKARDEADEEDLILLMLCSIMFKDSMYSGKITEIYLMLDCYKPLKTFHIAN